MALGKWGAALFSVVLFGTAACAAAAPPAGSPPATSTLSASVFPSSTLSPAPTASAVSPTVSASPSKAAPSPTPVEITFTAADLCGLVLTRADVPASLSFVVGPEPWGDDGCKSSFRPGENETPVLSSEAELAPDALAAQMQADFKSAVLFGGDEGAVQFDADLGYVAYCYLRQYEEVPGRTTYALISCVWAFGNVVLTAWYNAGQTVDERNVLDYAEIMQERAAAIAATR